MHNLVLLMFVTVCASFVCNGVYMASRERMILYPLRLWFKSWVKEYYMKPIFECIVCMSSVWGLPAVLILYTIAGHDYTFFEVAVCVVSLMPTNFIVYRLVEFE